MNKYDINSLYYETKSDFIGDWREPIPPVHDSLYIYPVVQPIYDQYPELNAYDPRPQCPKGYHYNNMSNACIYGKPYIADETEYAKNKCWYCRKGSTYISAGLDIASLSLAASGVGIKGAVVTYSLSLTNNMVTAVVCAEYESALRSETLNQISLWASLKKMPGAYGHAATTVDLAINLGAIYRQH